MKEVARKCVSSQWEPEGHYKCIACVWIALYSHDGALSQEVFMPWKMKGVEPFLHFFCLQHSLSPLLSRSFSRLCYRVRHLCFLSSFLFPPLGIRDGHPRDCTASSCRVSVSTYCCIQGESQVKDWKLAVFVRQQQHNNNSNNKQHCQLAWRKDAYCCLLFSSVPFSPFSL